MKNFIALLTFAVAFVCLATSHAANPREDLKQLTTQLQSNPGDTALREKIIKLATTIKPVPAVSEDARGSFVEGTTITKSARNPEQLSLAIQAFQKSADLAPWWGEAYYNLAVVQELAENFDSAESALQFYVLTGPSAKDTRAAKDKIHEIRAKAKITLQEDTVLMAKLNGIVFFRIEDGRHLGTGALLFRDEVRYRVDGSQIVKSYFRGWQDPSYKDSNINVGGTRELGRFNLKGRRFLVSDTGTFRTEGVISKDGQRLVVTTTYQGSKLRTEDEYLRSTFGSP